MVQVYNAENPVTAAPFLQSGGLTSVDFLPKCVKTPGCFSLPEYEPFGILIKRANIWLEENPDFRTKTCESIEFKLYHWEDVGKSSEKTYFIERSNKTWYIRGLRLWLVKEADLQETPQQIGCLNLVPRELNAANYVAAPIYETLGELLHRFNRKTDYPPIPGRILTIETQEMKIPTYTEFNPDTSFWIEIADFVRQYLFVIRVFYEEGKPENEEIGIMDFLPAVVNEGSKVESPEFEPLTNVIERASRWCSQQKALRFCNFQSLEVKMRNGTINTQKVNFAEHGMKTVYYARIIRVAYARRPGAMRESELRKVVQIQMSCKLFPPVPIGLNLIIPNFEGLSKTRKRIEAWMNATGARVISCETEVVRLFYGKSIESSVNSSLTFNFTQDSDVWVFVSRVYLDGTYKEPPPEMLPPLPSKKICRCTII